MEIPGLFENEYENEYYSKIGSFTCLENMAEWNGRTIKTLTENESATLSRIIKMRPMMSRPPSHVDVEITGGYNEERGGYIEGKISVSWDNPKSPPPSSDPKPKDVPSNDPNSPGN